jgi:hypothetical protein
LALFTTIQRKEVPIFIDPISRDANDLLGAALGPPDIMWKCVRMAYRLETKDPGPTPGGGRGACYRH